MARDTNKFCGIKDEQDRLNQSGKTEDDRIKDALKQYKAMYGKAYTVLPYWRALKDQPKWHAITAETALRKAKKNAAVDGNGEGAFATPSPLE